MKPDLNKMNSYLRQFIILVVNVLVIVLSLIAAFALRFDLNIPPDYWDVALSLIPWLIGIKLTVFWASGMSESWWRYVSMPDLLQVLKANLVASAVFIVFDVFYPPVPNLPRSVIILDFILCFSMMIGLRVFTRIVREQIGLRSKGFNSRPKTVLVVGSGAVAQSIVREMRENPKIDKSVLGYLDSDPKRIGKVILGVPVIGTLGDLERLCEQKRIDLVIIAQTSVNSQQLREIISFCQKNRITSKLLPTVGDIINGRVTLEQCRAVVLEDLLGRTPIRLNLPEIQKYLSGKRILVTGAAGSIGREICRQVCQFHPSRLVLVENAETPLFHLENELNESFPDQTIFPNLCDIRDKDRVAQVFWEHKPQVVFHAAAYKHVPMSELNPVEVVKNNVFGTKNIADSSLAIGVEHFVLISTDKAVNPTNIMGATKRVAEIYVQNLPRQGRTKAVTVRFGNVLGSHGSVIPIFRDQIHKGGPITVTHPEITRFFMTIPEAVQLVLQAGSMGEGGEIFLLDMGDPVKIVWLAEEMIRLSGLRPYEDIEIVFTGLRPGEKLFEELLIAGEGVKATRHEKIRVFQGTTLAADFLRQETEALLAGTRALDVEKVMRILKELVPEFHDNGEVVTQAFMSQSSFHPEIESLDLVGKKNLP
jgi:FlaA1/EpsC-like NDP-sugar epimerase